MRKKNPAPDDGGFEPGPAAASRITPLDVQEKRFRRSAKPRGGYVMREVDEFLDEVTDTLSALFAENERLRGEVSGPEPAGASPARLVADGDSRSAVDEFLRREKGFLQDLGGLVQAHAEELKSMVRSARASAAVGTATGETPAARSDVVEPMASNRSEEGSHVSSRPDDEAGSPTGAEEAAPTHAAIEDGEDGADAAPEASTGAVADEPIRLEEPEPSRSRRSEEDRDGSLRELFWGEE